MHSKLGENVNTYVLKTKQGWSWISFNFNWQSNDIYIDDQKWTSYYPPSFIITPKGMERHELVSIIKNFKIFALNFTHFVLS